MNATYFIWIVCVFAAGFAGFAMGAKQANRYWRGKAAWMFDEQDIAQQMAEDGWRRP